MSPASYAPLQLPYTIMVYGLTSYIREYFNTTVPSNREFKYAKKAKIANPRNVTPQKLKCIRYLSPTHVQAMLLSYLDTDPRLSIPENQTVCCHCLCWPTVRSTCCYSRAGNAERDLPRKGSTAQGPHKAAAAATSLLPSLPWNSKHLECTELRLEHAVLGASNSNWKARAAFMSVISFRRTGPLIHPNYRQKWVVMPIMGGTSHAHQLIKPCNVRWLVIPLTESHC